MLLERLPSDRVIMGVSGMARKSAKMIRPGMSVVLDNQTRYIEDRRVDEKSGMIILIDGDGNVFRRPPGAKLDVV